MLLQFLKGKVYEFYSRQVSDSPGTWRLDDFFTELFIYCFHLDYRCYQGDK
ncbi:hypothetical protein DFH29DRAFT_804390 [Suillus ampliporus]|nr:hypothetical protein DFH29DRAFT_804390 [Suillus ampliporus]